MSADLSRRLARLKLLPPIRDLSTEDRRALFSAVHTTTAFDQLPDRFQEMIIAAETTRERVRSTQQEIAAPASSAARSIATGTRHPRTERA